MKQLHDRCDLQFYMRAFDYLCSAHLIVTNRSSQDIFKTPILFLVGFAIELTLKANLFSSGMSNSDVKNFGHKVSKLWKLDASKGIRERAEQLVVQTLDTFPKNKALETLDLFVADIDRLHSGGNSGYYPLRYQAARDEDGPAPYLLIKIFLQITHEGLVNILNDFDLMEDRPDGCENFKKKILNSHYFQFSP